MRFVQKPLITQFFRYVVVGGSGVFLDIGLLIIAKEWLGIGATMGVIVTQLVVLAYNFILNKYWSFQSTHLAHKQLVRYLSLAACNYGFSAFAMYIGHDIFGWYYVAVRIGTIALMVTWNFALYKWWVYR